MNINMEISSTRNNQPSIRETQETPLVPARIVVNTIRRFDDRGNLRAFATITVLGIKIDGVRIIQQPGPSPWVSMPQNEVPAKDGGRSRWYPVVQIVDTTLKDQISEAVLSAWPSSG